MLNFLCATERSFSLHQLLITAGQSECDSTSTNTSLLTSLERAPSTCLVAVHNNCECDTLFTRCNRLSKRLYNRIDSRIDNRLYRVNGALELRVLRNHPRRALFEMKTPLRSAESTSVNIAPHDWSWRASAVGRRRRRLRAAATGDLTARCYCSFQGTKCDKKLTSAS